MRKASIFVILAVLAVSLIGCSQQADEMGGNESATPPSSFSAGETEETTTPNEESTETANPEETAVIEATDEAEQPAAAQNTGDTDTQSHPSGSQADNGSISTPSQTSQPPAPIEPPKATEPPATPPPPTEPPTPKTAYDAPYDVAAIIADAKAYGESIGMTWSEPLTTGNCSWEAPGATSSTLSGERLKTAIEGRIRRIKKLQEDNEYKPGKFHFKVVFEPIGDGEYTIIFLMG